jgi:hypothetical protein
LDEGLHNGDASFEMRPLGAPQDEGKALMALREIPHPEEAAKAAVSKDARRPIQPTMDFLPGLSAHPILQGYKVNGLNQLH